MTGRVNPVSRLVAGAISLMAASCSDESNPVDTGCTSAAVVYGEDDRREPFDTEEAWESLARRTAVAVMDRWLIERLSDGTLDEREFVAGRRLDLCSGERFADQPTLAGCTAIELEPDLMLTAGHCLPPSGCEDFAFVKGFEWSADGRLHELDFDSVRYCKEVLAYEHDGGALGAKPDFALVRLEAPLPFTAAHGGIRTEPLARGEELVLAGYPVGLPLKIARGLVVGTSAPSTSFFGAELDSFAGNSGGPVFDSDGALVGIAVAGQTDFTYDEEASCSRVSVATVDVAAGRYELIGYVAAALKAACDAGARQACALGAKAAYGPSVSGCTP